MTDYIGEFLDAMRSAGIETSEDILPDGKIHRFSCNGRKDDTAGWYLFFGDGIPAGCFGSWRECPATNWRADIGRRLTPEEEQAHRHRVEVIRQLRDAEEKQVRAECRGWCDDSWKKARSASGDHEYLKAKGVQAYGLKQMGDSLLMPLRDMTGSIQGIQFIAPDGSKKFKTGTSKKGNYFAIGKPKDKTLLLCEGYATGGSLHECTGHAVAVCFDAGNLVHVAEALRKKYPDFKLVICGDHDESGVGQKAARLAVVAASVLVVFPPAPGMDFNDMHQQAGKEAVNACIEAVTLPGQAVSAAAERRVDLVRGSELAPEPVTWFWTGWLAAGKMHILGGAPGTGKTTIAMALAATVTTGGRWPDGSISPAGNVVIWSGEDDPQDTLIPRLALSGADLSKVYFISDVRDGKERRSFDPAKDMDMLRIELDKIGDVLLLIVDPIVAAIMGDSHKNAEVRRGLQPLVDLAASMRCALLGITHFSKGTGGRDPVERLTGSLAFGALARVVMVAAKQQEEGDDGETVRLFVRAKSNIGPDDGGFNYDLTQGEMKDHPGIFSSYVLWGESLEGSARELLATAETIPEEKTDSRGDTEEWLKQILEEEGGRLDLKKVMAAAAEMGYSKSKVHRARKKLGIEIGIFGFGSNKKSIWKLPIISEKPQSFDSFQQNLTETIETIGTIERIEEQFSDAEVF